MGKLSSPLRNHLSSRRHIVTYILLLVLIQLLPHHAVHGIASSSQSNGQQQQLKVTVPRIPPSELENIVTQATLNVKRRLEVIEPSILASGWYPMS